MTSCSSSVDAHVAVQPYPGCTVSVAEGTLECHGFGWWILSLFPLGGKLLPVAGLAVVAGKMNGLAPVVPFSGSFFEFFGANLCVLEVCF